MSGLYNMINGVNPATFFILPMLGKHPDQYPRFRDCFLGELSNSKDLDEIGIPIKINDITKKVISVYMRIGGGDNRNTYSKEIDELRAMPTYIKDYDDDFDNTYATFQFGFPFQFQDMYDAIMTLKPLNESPKEYQEILYKIFPKLSESFDKLFKK